MMEKKKEENKLKEFFKPTKGKLIGAIVFFVISLLYIFYFSFSYLYGYDPNNSLIFWFLFFPSSLAFLILENYNIESILSRQKTTVIFIGLIVLQVIYWYLLSCIIVYLLSRIVRNNNTLK